VDRLDDLARGLNLAERQVMVSAEFQRAGLRQPVRDIRVWRIVAKS
jgi:hypothetical protein